MRHFLMAAAMLCALAGAAEARIVRLEGLKVEPAFGGRVFGDAGAYERVTGRAHGEVDPGAPANALIQDIALAPRNARGMVEYVTDIDILRPADPARSNRVLFFNIANRGNRGGFGLFNAREPGGERPVDALREAGDGWLQRNGYTEIWFGWQGDVLPGADRLRFELPVARNPDGTSITGIVRAEFASTTPETSLDLGAGWFTAGTHASYPTARIDNRTPDEDGFLPLLTVRAWENAPRVVIPNGEWSFAHCPDGATRLPDPRRICYPAGFAPGKLYELIYRARDPLVLALGFAAARDLASFLKHAEADDAGTPNPVRHGPEMRAIAMGSSQSGRMLRSFLHLGFNADEAGRRAFDGLMPHIATGRLPLAVRFAQPGRAWGQQIDHLYPAYDFPFGYARQTDPLTGRTQGLLDRCAASGTCPRIVHVASTLEIWEGRQSLGLTDPLGTRDVPPPENVRYYVLASTQHSAAPLPLRRRAPFGTCAFQGNPNPQIWTMRALLAALTGWVRDGAAPPPSATPRIADGTLVAPDRVAFPEIPANRYGGTERPALRYTALMDPLHVLDRGPLYDAGDMRGVITIEPPNVGTASYGVLVPQVDADGNELGGVRSLFLRVPVGTYTGWNRFRPGYFGEGFCNLTGAFVPFAPTRAERLAAGDPRPSVEERYPTRAAYVAAMREAAARLVAARFLLAEDAAQLVGEAERDGIRSGP
jgi:hypothetical protein